MGTYANIYIEYYNNKEDKWELINPTYLDKKIDSCYRQGSIRDLLDDRGWYQTPTKSGYPENISNELSEIFKKEDETDYKPYNRGYITLDKFTEHINRKIKETEESIKNARRVDDIAVCNIKIDLLSKYILTKDEKLVESIEKINSIDYQEELEYFLEYKEELEYLNYALQFCHSIAFLVEFLTGSFIWEDDYSKIRIVYNFT